MQRWRSTSVRQCFQTLRPPALATYFLQPLRSFLTVLGPARVRQESRYNLAVACEFCEIVAGDRHAALVLEDQVSIAFLDTRPLFPGHVLLIPRQHYETLVDLPRDLVGPLFVNAQSIAAAVEKGLGAEGSFVALNNRVSQSVPHLHVHIVPRRRKDGLRGFFWPRQRYRDEAELAATAEALRAAIRELQPYR
jgi:histidine triad (HIT) family protein